MNASAMMARQTDNAAKSIAGDARRPLRQASAGGVAPARRRKLTRGHATARPSPIATFSGVKARSTSLSIAISPIPERQRAYCDDGIFTKQPWRAVVEGQCRMRVWPAIATDGKQRHRLAGRATRPMRNLANVSVAERRICARNARDLSSRRSTSSGRVADRRLSRHPAVNPMAAKQLPDIRLSTRRSSSRHRQAPTGHLCRDRSRVSARMAAGYSDTNTAITKLIDPQHGDVTK